MRYPVTPVRPEPGNKAITILRVFLWLMPAFFIPVSAVIAVRLFNLLYGKHAHIVLGLCILVLIATAAVGYFDRRLDLMQKKIAPPHSKKDLALCTILFVLAQIIFAPVVCFIVYGYFAVTGNM